MATHARSKPRRTAVSGAPEGQRQKVFGRGGGKSGGTSRAPVEAPNTLRSKAYARVIDLISEGEIGGLVDSLKSVYFNDTVLQNVDGSLNFNNVTLLTREGLPDQDSIPGFPAVETEVAVSAQVVLATPIVRAVTNADATAVRVTIRVPSLQAADSGTGDINPTSVQIAIDVQPDGGAYAEQVNDVISGKAVSPYQRAYRIQLTGSAPWNVRVRRITADSGSATLQNDTFWDSYTVIEDYRLQYSNSAVVGVAVDAESFGGRVPSRKYLIKGLKTEIPSNYNPVTRVYTGVWNGTFVTAWHDNPAWVLYACISAERWGLGEYIPLAFRDKWTLYTIGQYCDELVPDGFGGTEPRYTFNAVIATPDAALKVCQSIASVFRGMIYWGSAGVTATADRDLDPVKLVTPSNVIGGLINWSGGGLKARHTVVQVTWYDPEDLYRTTIEVVEGDPEDIERFGWRTLELVAFGCTSRGQAHRMGRWALETEASEAEAANWQAAFDHSDVYPGEIVEVQDPAYAGVNFGGRLVAQPGATSLQLDRPIALEVGKTYSIRTTLADGTVEQRTVTTAVGVTTDTLSIASAFSTAPVIGAVWIITSSAVAPRKMKIISRKENKNLYDISAVLHDPTKYARIEQNLALERPVYTALPSGPVVPPTALAWQECLTLVSGGAARSRVVLSWTASPDARVILYEVENKPPDQDWQSATPDTTTGVSTDLLDLTSGVWGFRVRAVSDLGATSSWLTQESATLDGLLFAPDDITNLHFSHVDQTSTIKWDEITDFRPHRYEIRKGAAWATALQIGDVAHPPFPTVGDDTYWVAAYIGPDAGPKVYSDIPDSVTISGSVISGNVIATFDQVALGWTGSFTGGAGVDSPNIRTGGAGDVTAESDITTVPDILNLGGQQSGVYTIPVANRVTLTSPAACRVMIDYSAQGAAVGSDVTAEADVTLNPDITGSAMSRFIDVYPEIRLSQDGAAWAAWQRFSPGIYTAKVYDARMQLITLDPAAIAYCTNFVFAVDVPDRTDHITDFALDAAGNAFLHRPDGAVSDAAFNGGPNGSLLPNISVDIRDAVEGDTILRSAESLSGFTMQIKNAGVGVARHVDIRSRGY